jgi:CheY-like chemotaxis protein
MAAPPCHVALLVEDDPACAKSLGDQVLALGHTFVHASTLDEAIAAIGAGGFCYVLLDLEIPARAGMAPDVGCGETVLERLRKRYPHRNREGRHHLQIVVVTGFSNDGEFSSRLHQMDADVFVNKASLARPGHLSDQIRKSLVKAGRGEHEECREPGQERVGASAAAATVEAAAVRATDSTSTARVRLVIDGRRSERRVGLLVNGVRVRLPDQLFLFLLRLVVAHVRAPLAWHSLVDLGFAEKVGLPYRLRTEFEPVVPEGFVLLEKGAPGEYRLNPEIAVEHVDWRALQEDEDPALARVAREGARAAAT